MANEVHSELSKQPTTAALLSCRFSQIQLQIGELRGTSSSPPANFYHTDLLLDGLEQLQKEREAKDRSLRRLEAENDDLNYKLDSEVKTRQRNVRAQKADQEIRATRCQLEEESACETIVCY